MGGVEEGGGWGAVRDVHAEERGHGKEGKQMMEVAGQEKGDCVYGQRRWLRRGEVWGTREGGEGHETKRTGVEEVGF